LKWSLTKINLVFLKQFTLLMKDKPMILCLKLISPKLREMKFQKKFWV